ncbi:MAG: glycosyltransferase [Lachnospiraceae bacterium]|nr:glycosyltransferase [Lachnospiraceae bacterium]
MQINQFHSGTAVGDAITNQMIALKKLLRSKGYESEIYAEYVDERLANEIKSIHEYAGKKENILFVHHSMGMNCFDKIISLPDKKALIYHNITPEHFFEDEGTKRAIRQGLHQAKEYQKHVDYCIADSNYNRKELMGMGHRNVDVMPIQISLDRFDHTDADSAVLDKNKAKKNFLFVGRVVPNKCQTDIISSFAVYTNYYNADSCLYIVGDDGMQSYVETLKKMCCEYGIEDKVFFTGKVSEEELKAYYEIADIFLCMSEHEGFGVPLLEAMKMGVPVVSYRSSAVPETMDGAGIVVKEKNYAYIAALCNEILTDNELYQKIVQSETARINRLENTDTENIFFKIIDNICSGKRTRQIQMQGPFESSYSLAIVNRKLMEAMDDLHTEDEVSIYCTEGPGDYQPKEEDLVDKPHARALWEKSKDVTYPDVTIRNMYPPRVYDVKGGLNFQSFAWEESAIPNNYIEDFNRYLSGIGTTSDYVTEMLIENGIQIPVKTMGNGVELVKEFEELKPYSLKTKKTTKFLHISSAFPRKGVDVLLKGYYEAFTQNDDVCLVLKTFPNPHNNVEELLKELNAKYPNGPEVEWINCDLSSSELNRLYKAADCYVQTARGEGFGLPVAEAMLAKIPVIVCANSGMADFCNEKTALLVGYNQVPANTHVADKRDGKISMWFEPSLDDLIIQFRRFIFERESLNLDIKIQAAYDLISTEYTWEAVAKRWISFIEEVADNQIRPRVSMVTTWNSKCGIAEYTRMEVEATQKNVEYRIYPDYASQRLVRDETFVASRLWGNVFEGDMSSLTQALFNDSSDIVHFQFNYGFYQLNHLAQAITKLHDEKKIVITFHKTADGIVADQTVSLRSIVDALNLCAALIVHQKSDRDLLISYGVRKEIVYIVTHGQMICPGISAKTMQKQKNIIAHPVIGSYGFLLPHKGIKEVIQAISSLKKEYPDILYMPVCALYDASISKDYYKECREEVEKLGLEKNVKFITDFLPNHESMAYLQACDVLIMPYKPTKESASGAIRPCLAVKRPLITTKQPIFDEFKAYTYQIESTETELIADAIRKMVEDKEMSAQYLSAINRYIEDTSWYATADKLYELYRKIM